MIKLITKGSYQLVWTKDGRRMLYLGEQGYLWSQAGQIGELLSFSRHPHRIEYVMAQGRYRLYSVKDEPNLIDLQHLELSLGAGKWQGYLLLTGLPSAKKIRRRILATTEIIGS